jgi:hypothetical protein
LTGGKDMIGAEAIVKCLEKENTEVSFGYS